MLATSVSSTTIVPEALDDSNYKTWSNCMKDYLSGQDLWDDIIKTEPEAEADEETVSDSSKNNKKAWKKKNSLALHAIKVSCSPDFLSRIVIVQSAKTAWDLLADYAAAHEDDDEEEKEEEEDTTVDGIKYDPFIKDVRDGDWGAIEKFIDAHPQAITAKVFNGGTLLHYLLGKGDYKIAALLVKKITVDDMEILDEVSYTPLAVGAKRIFHGQLHLLDLMVSKHPNLPNIGIPETLPVVVAAWKGFKETTRFLYSVTVPDILDPKFSTYGASLLINCIENMIFDIAVDLVQKFPGILCQSTDYGEYPIQALAKTLSALFPSEREYKKSSPLKKWLNSGGYILKYLHHLLGDENVSYTSDSELIYRQARGFLELVCSHVSTFDTTLCVEAVYPAMIEASKNGNIEFINEMLSANPDLIFAHLQDGKTIFWHAITNRHEKVFNLIYPTIDNKDSLLFCGAEDRNNILHIAALLPPKPILDRTLKSPALQIQREFLWFKEVQSIVEPWYKGGLNDDRLTPGELFHKSHTGLIEAGEKLMRDTAQSCTVVGALIVTIMFAAAFTVPGGNNQDTGYPLFGSDVLFKIFISCDALALSSSTASILIFLEILTSSYVVEDFVLYLPKKTMMGLLTLFISIAAMMITFCTAIAIMFGRRTQFILPIALLASTPVLLFMSSIFSLMYQIYMTTFGPCIFKRDTKLPAKKEDRVEIIRNRSSGDQIVYVDH